MKPSQNLKPRYEEILGRVSAAAGERAPGVTLVAVGKGQSPDAIEALYRLGHRVFGENYAQELLEKSTQLEARGCADIHWHFIGHLQTNKVKALIPYIAAVHSVDSEKLALELARQWEAKGRKGKLPVFIEINIDEQPSKSGVLPSEAAILAEKISRMPSLSLQGLMCIPEPGKSAGAFSRLKTLEEKCRPFTQGKLSMGMSDDFDEAIRAGATHVRVGTALFGPRPVRKA